MANILLTNYCNRNCQYCFAMDKVKGGMADRGTDRAFMSLADFATCLDFLRRNRLRMISLLGGEPTLHPQFLEVLDLCRRDSFFIDIKLFTNGLMTDETIEYLADFEGPELHIALNIHPPADYSPAQWERIEQVMIRLGPKVGLGYNIFQPENDFTFLLELFLKYRLSPHIRLGLAQPIVGLNNAHLPLESLPEVAEKIVAAAGEFTRQNLFFAFDCGFPFCMFTLDQHQKLLSFAIPFRSLCSPIVDIGPDLSVWRCFPLSRIHNRRLLDFEAKMDFEHSYHGIFRPYQQFGIYDRCIECNYKKQRLCTGGCLSRILREFHGRLGANAQNPTEGK